MDKILIAADSEKNASTLSSFADNLSLNYEITTSFDTDALVQKLNASSFSLVIVFGSQNLCKSLRKASDIDVLWIAVKEEIIKNSAEMSSIGIFSLCFPFENWELSQAIRFISATHRRFASLKKEKDGLAKKVEDMKIIDRAKCCLIHYLRISEATAHRHIEKQAMDMRLTKRQVAEEILKKYEA